ncbi:MAG: hypothetical protein L0958_01165 [Candidatus Mariimomonas ferrooxydans]
MAKRGGMYSANKRKKELKRNKKQEEKRQKRQNKGHSQDPKASIEPVSFRETPVGTGT